MEPGRGYSITVDNNNKRIGEANEVKNQKIKVEERIKKKKDMMGVSTTMEEGNGRHAGLENQTLVVALFSSVQFRKK